MLSPYCQVQLGKPRSFIKYSCLGNESTVCSAPALNDVDHAMVVSWFIGGSGSNVHSSNRIAALKSGCCGCPGNRVGRINDPFLQHLVNTRRV